MTSSHARAPRSRGAVVWLWVVAGVLVLAVAAVAAVLLTNRGGAAEEPKPSAVTLPAPTPTVSAIPKVDGSDFYDGLPATVLAFALSQVAPGDVLLGAGALEGYQLDYTDGAQTVTVLAGQWPTAEEASAAAAILVTAASDGAAAEPTTAPVEVDGTEVGTATTIEHDGTTTIVWTNGTAVLQASGPSAAVPDLYTAYAM